MGKIPEYPPILTNNSQQDLYNLREYIIRNIDKMAEVSGCQASVYFEEMTEILQTVIEEGGGKAANLQDNKTVTPTSAQQTVVPDPEYDGLKQVTVEAAPTEALSVTPGNIPQTLYPSTGKVGFSSVAVAAVDENLLETGSATPATSQQVLTPSQGKMGFSEVTIAATPLETPAAITPTTSDQTIAPTGANIGLTQVVVAGDADLIAGNIKKDVVIFGVTGTYEGSIPINGSLIEITCSSNIDEVTATVNGNTYTARLDIGTHIAYVTIPYTDTIAAQTCVLKGYNSGSQVTSSYVSMAIGIGYYTADLSTSDYLFNYGTYYGVSDTSWTSTGPGSGTVTNGVNNIHIECNNGNYAHNFKLNSHVDTRGYQNFEITYVIVSGSITGGGGEWAPGSSFVRIADTQQGKRAFINFPTSSGAVSIQTRTSTNGSYAISDAELQFTFSCPMGGTPFVIDIYSIKFV